MEHVSPFHLKEDGNHCLVLVKGKLRKSRKQNQMAALATGTQRWKYQHGQILSAGEPLTYCHSDELMYCVFSKLCANKHFQGISKGNPSAGEYEAS